MDGCNFLIDIKPAGYKYPDTRAADAILPRASINLNRESPGSKPKESMQLSGLNSETKRMQSLNDAMP